MGDGASLKIGVVVVNWNKKELLRACLESLRRQSMAPAEVAVVDNASSDGSAGMVRGLGGVTLLENPENLGGSGGFNRGMRYFLEQGRVDCLYLLDNDVELHPLALERLCRRMARGDVGICGSKIFYHDRPHIIWSFGCRVDAERLAVVHEFEGCDDGPETERERYPDLVPACSLLADRAVAETIGLWDDFFIYGDDTDWCLRAGKAGFRIVAVPDSHVLHHVGASHGGRNDNPLVTYYGWRNRAVIFSRHGRPDSPDRLLEMFVREIDKARGQGNRPRLRALSAAYHDWLFGRMGRRDDLVPPEEEKP